MYVDINVKMQGVWRGGRKDSGLCLFHSAFFSPFFSSKLISTMSENTINYINYTIKLPWTEVHRFLHFILLSSKALEIYCDLYLHVCIEYIHNRSYARVLYRLMLNFMLNCFLFMRACKSATLFLRVFLFSFFSF